MYRGKLRGTKLSLTNHLIHDIYSGSHNRRRLERRQLCESVKIMAKMKSLQGEKLSITCVSLEHVIGYINLGNENARLRLDSGRRNVTFRRIIVKCDLQNYKDIA